MEVLNNDVLYRILDHSRPLLPALREVCRRWRDYCAEPRPGADKPHKLTDLAGDGHYALLVWAVPIHTPPPTRPIPNECMARAAESGHEAVVRLCAGWGATNFNLAMVRAAYRGHEAIVHLCAGWGATDFDGAMASAADGGHEAIVHFCVSWGATDFAWAMASAAYSGHEAIARLCRDWIVDNAGEFGDRGELAEKIRE